MRQLYLHIGYPQTGTTSIQRFLAENAGQLAKTGTLYPQAGRLDDAHRLFNFAMGIGMYDRPPSLEIPTTLRQDLLKEIAESHCDRVVISSEYFAAATLADKVKVKQYFADFDVKIVVYLSRHDYALESAFIESVKSVANPPWEPTIDSFVLYQLGMGTVSYDYLGVLKQWAAQFGQHAIIVRPFESSQNVPDIFADLLKAIGVGGSEVYVRPETINASLSTQTIRAVQAVRHTSVTPNIKSEIVRQLIKMDESSGPQAYLSPAIRQSIVRRFGPSYQLIAKEFMGRADGVIFKDPMPKATDDWERLQSVQSGEVLERVLQALAARLS